MWLGAILMVGLVWFFPLFVIIGVTLAGVMTDPAIAFGFCLPFAAIGIAQVKWKLQDRRLAKSRHTL